MLGKACCTPADQIKIVLPSGHIVNKALSPFSLDQLLEGGTAAFDVAASLTHCANFCMAKESSDMPVDTIKWSKKDAAQADLKVGNALGFEDQVVSRVAKALGFAEGQHAVIEGMYTSDNVMSKECWWIDSNFRAFASAAFSKVSC